MLLRKKIYQISLAATIFAIGSLLFASSALAEKTNEIKVELWNGSGWELLCQDEECQNSLKVFDRSDFLPGDTAERKVKITNEDVASNGSGTEQEIAIEAINATNPCVSGLGLCIPPLIGEYFGDMLNFKVKESGGGVTYEKTLSEFFNENGETVITSSAIENGEQREFIFSVYFNDTGDDRYQKKSIGFDIIFGLKGDEGGAPPSSGGGLPPGLTILNESVKTTGINEHGVTIIWTTSYFSTSQVIYSSESEYNNGYKFDLTKPNYGYFSAFPNPEDLTKVTAHTVTLIGLSPGTIYYYRTVSHASPPTISREYTFTTLGGKRGGSQANEDANDNLTAFNQSAENISEENVPSAPSTETASEQENDSESNDVKLASEKIKEGGESGRVEGESALGESGLVKDADKKTTRNIQDNFVNNSSNLFNVIIIIIAAAMLAIAAYFVYRSKKRSGKI